ncbi:family 78 glycoside hydrolase catalytic domain [Flavilitoribacter nigricans]|nr:family 78 glycoside hydrolase catalytic domain [Flavilitoribacter nigricans]
MKILSKTALWLLPLLLFAFSQPNAEYRVIHTSVDNMENPTGVELETFFFSWKLDATERQVKQSAYQILLADAEDFSKAHLIWDSKKIKQEQSILIPYKGPSLQPGRTYNWKIRSWSDKGHASDWSAVAQFTTGLFTEADWKGAEWIAYDQMPPENRLVPGIHHPGKAYRGKDLGFHKLPIFRREFSRQKPLKKAMVFVTGLGHYELYLNGEQVGNRVLAPGWTHYDAEVLYNIFDCTEQIKSGTNALAMMLGNGFFVVPNSRYRKVMTGYGNPMLKCRLQLIYEDGTEENIVSDTNWKTIPGPITYSSMYSGEHYDSRLEPDNWQLAGFNDRDWQAAIRVPAPCEELKPERDYPVEVTQELSHGELYANQEQENSWTYDFEQNASGMFRVRVQGQPGDTIRLVPGELIFDSYAVNQKATGRTHDYSYVLKSNKPEIWQPRFTYYGFRYIQVDRAVPAGKENPDELPVILDLKMLHMRNAMPETGQFATSHPLFSQINDLIRWAINSNVQSVVTDCPHREKLGWLEQTYLMGGSIHYNYDVYGLYKKLVNDMIVAQTDEGLVPAIVPEYVRFGGDFTDSPEWGSAGVIVPWLIYKWYGDQSVLRKAWPMMEAYVAYLRDRSEDHIVSHGLGDWYDLGPERPGYSQLTPKSLTATAIYFYDVQLLSKIAELLGKHEAQREYHNWAEAIKTAFNWEFFDPKTKIYSTGSQTAISMPLVLGLVAEEDRAEVEATLVRSIENSDFALTAGDVGFHFLVKALQDSGNGSIIYRMNARDDVPGYGYQLKKGATALTESWQALEVVSNNHLMLGHIMEWFYNGLAGIGQAADGVAYKEIVIQPQMLSEIGYTEGSFETPYGSVRSAWNRTDSRIELEVNIPVNTTATVVLPATELSKLTVDHLPLSASGIRFEEDASGEHIRVFVGSGEYGFVVSL